VAGVLAQVEAALLIEDRIAIRVEAIDAGETRRGQHRAEVMRMLQTERVAEFVNERLQAFARGVADRGVEQWDAVVGHIDRQVGVDVTRIGDVDLRTSETAYSGYRIKVAIDRLVWRSGISPVTRDVLLLGRMDDDLGVGCRVLLDERDVRHRRPGV